MKIIEIVKNKENATIISANVCQGYDSKSLAIDSRTGEIFTNFLPKQLEHESNFEARLQMAGLQFMKTPLTLDFDGRKVNFQLQANENEMALI